MYFGVLKVFSRELSLK